MNFGESSPDAANVNGIGSSGLNSKVTTPHNGILVGDLSKMHLNEVTSFILNPLGQGKTTPPFKTEHANEDLDTLLSHKLLEMGFDPSLILEMAASGSEIQSGGGDYVRVIPSYENRSVSSGYGTFTLDTLPNVTPPEGVTFLRDFVPETILPEPPLVLPQIAVSPFDVSELDLPNGSARLLAEQANVGFLGVTEERDDFIRQPEFITVTTEFAITAGSNAIDTIRLQVDADNSFVVDEVSYYALQLANGDVEIRTGEGNELILSLHLNIGSIPEPGQSAVSQLEVTLYSNILADSGAQVANQAVDYLSDANSPINIVITDDEGNQVGDKVDGDIFDDAPLIDITEELSEVGRGELFIGTWRSLEGADTAVTTVLINGQSQTLARDGEVSFDIQQGTLTVYGQQHAEFAGTWEFQSDGQAGDPVPFSFSINLTDLDNDSSTDTTRLFITLESGLAVTKSADVSSVDAAGQEITYTIQVQNTGNQSVDEIQIFDPLFDGGTIDGPPIAGDGNDNDILDVGETWTYQATYIVTQDDIDNGNPSLGITPDTKDIENIVLVTGTTPDDATVEGNAFATVDIEESSGLAVTKVADVQTVDAVDDLINYTITLNNTGNQTLSNVEVTDPLLTNLTYQGGDIDGDNKLDVTEIWTYTGSHTVTQDNLDFGITASETQTPVVDIENTATAQASEPDGDIISGNASVTVGIAEEIDLSVDKSSDVDSVNAVGQLINYTISITNNGNQALNTINVNDPMLANLTFISTDMGNIGLLDVGETWQYTGSYSVTQNDLNSGVNIENIATVTGFTPNGTLVTSTGEDDVAVEDLDPGVVISYDNGQGFALNELHLSDGRNPDASQLTEDATVTVVAGNQALSSIQLVANTTGSFIIAGNTFYLQQVGGAGNPVTVSRDAAGNDVFLTLNLGTSDNGFTAQNSIASLPSPGTITNYLLRAELTDNYLNQIADDGAVIIDVLTAATQHVQVVVTDVNNDVAAVAVVGTVTDDIPLVDITEELTEIGDDQLFTGSWQSAEGADSATTTVTVGDSSLTLARNGSVEFILDEGTLTVFGQQHPTNAGQWQFQVDANAADPEQVTFSISLVDDDGDSSVDSSVIEILPLLQLTITKVVDSVTNPGGDTNDTNTVDQAGDVINYTITVTNDGNTTLTNVTVEDPLTGLSETIASLAPGASEIYNTSYEVVQADIDSDGGGDDDIDNTATADSDETDAVKAEIDVPIVERQPAISVTYTNGLGFSLDEQYLSDGSNPNASLLIDDATVTVTTASQNLTSIELVLTSTNPITTVAGDTFYLQQVGGAGNEITVSRDVAGNDVFLTINLGTSAGGFTAENSIVTLPNPETTTNYILRAELVDNYLNVAANNGAQIVDVLDAINSTVQVVVTEVDNDEYSVNIVGAVTDDTPLADADENLAVVNQDSNDVPVEILSNLIPGADGVTSVVFSGTNNTTILNGEGLPLQYQGVDILVTGYGTTQLTATAGGQPVFTMNLSQNNGQNLVSMDVIQEIDQYETYSYGFFTDQSPLTEGTTTLGIDGNFDFDLLVTALTDDLEFSANGLGIGTNDTFDSGEGVRFDFVRGVNTAGDSFSGRYPVNHAKVKVGSVSGGSTGTTSIVLAAFMVSVSETAVALSTDDISVFDSDGNDITDDVTISVNSGEITVSGLSSNNTVVVNTLNSSGDNFNAIEVSYNADESFTLDSVSALYDQGAIGFNVNAEATDGDGDIVTTTIAVDLQQTLIVGDNGSDDSSSTTPFEVGNGSGEIIGSQGDNTIAGDVGGDVQIALSLNLVLIMDSSGSMDSLIQFTDENGNTSNMERVDAMQDAMVNLLNVASTSGAANIRVHLIEFDSNATDLGTYDIISNGVISNSELTSANNAINSFGANGGTDYGNGLTSATQWANLAEGSGGPLTDANFDNLFTEVLFVSDGRPNDSGYLSDVVTLVDALQTKNANFDHIEAIGIALSNQNDIDILTSLEQYDGTGTPSGDTANNITTANELSDLVESLVFDRLADAGDDTINGNPGDNVIYGDVFYTDDLAADLGLTTLPGSGWQVFNALENTNTPDPDNPGQIWTRDTTLDYMFNNIYELAQETTVTGFGGEVIARQGGNDTITGGDGDDTIFGQEGNDVIDAGADNDYVSGGSGEDSIDGGSGNNAIDLSDTPTAAIDFTNAINSDGFTDTLIFDIDTFDGTNTVYSFDVDQDILNFTDVMDTSNDGVDVNDLDALLNNITENSGSLNINMNNGATIVLLGVTAADAGIVGALPANSFTDLTDIQVQVNSADI